MERFAVHGRMEREALGDRRLRRRRVTGFRRQYAGVRFLKGLRLPHHDPLL